MRNLDRYFLCYIPFILLPENPGVYSPDVIIWGMVSHVCRYDSSIPK